MAAVGRSLRQWWTHTNDAQLLLAQQQLLSSLVKSPMVSSEQYHGLNTVSFHARPSAKANKILPTVVMLHGFGSGLGFFFANIDRLLESGQVGKVLLVDWLGMGGSGENPESACIVCFAVLRLSCSLCCFVRTTSL